ncbi:hypothetical protein TeGR_g13944, partial [Tetraparma gracilis]
VKRELAWDSPDEPAFEAKVTSWPVHGGEYTSDLAANLAAEYWGKGGAPAEAPALKLPQCRCVWCDEAERPPPRSNKKRRGAPIGDDLK